VASWAYKMALEGSLISADVIEADEFIDLHEKYRVVQVPMVVANETSIYDGPWGRNPSYSTSSMPVAAVRDWRQKAPARSSLSLQGSSGFLD